MGAPFLSPLPPPAPGFAPCRSASRICDILFIRNTSVAFPSAGPPLSSPTFSLLLTALKSGVRKESFSGRRETAKRQVSRLAVEPRLMILDVSFLVVASLSLPECVEWVASSLSCFNPRDSAKPDPPPPSPLVCVYQWSSRLQSLC